METAQLIDMKEYIRKINKVEIMLDEIKQGLATFNKDLQESIQRGEEDITAGRVVVCKTSEELDHFFANI